MCHQKREQQARGAPLLTAPNRKNKGASWREKVGETVAHARDRRHHTKGTRTTLLPVPSQDRSQQRPPWGIRTPACLCPALPSDRFASPGLRHKGCRGSCTLARGTGRYLLRLPGLLGRRASSLHFGCGGHRRRWLQGTRAGTPPAWRHPGIPRHPRGALCQGNMGQAHLGHLPGALQAPRAAPPGRRGRKRPLPGASPSAVRPWRLSPGTAQRRETRPRALHQKDWRSRRSPLGGALFAAHVSSHLSFPRNSTSMSEQVRRTLTAATAGHP